MKNCKHCHEEIAKSAKMCPKCGGRLGMPTFAKLLILFVIIIVCIVACTNSCSKAVNDAFGGYDDQNGITTFHVGEIFNSKYLKVAFDSYNNNFTNYSEYSDIKSSYKIVQFKFTAENISDDNQTFDYTDFNCYADNETMQQFYGTNDSGLDSGGTVSPGKKVTVPIYCEVPKTASKISVEFKPLFAEKNYEFVNN